MRKHYITTTILVTLIFFLGQYPCMGICACDVNNDLQEPDFYIHGLCFSPYMDGQGPPDIVSLEQVQERLCVIAPHTPWIRTYSATNGFENIPAEAKSLGLQVAMGTWIRDNKETEINNLVSKAQLGVVDIAIIGNEEIYHFGESALNGLIDDLNDVRQRLDNVIPVTTAEPFQTLFSINEEGVCTLNYPDLIDAMDVVFVNIYPFHDGISIDNAFIYLASRYQSAVDAVHQQDPDKPVVISETGWPSTGETKGDAQPSLCNLRKYFFDVSEWSIDNDIPVFFFEAFDENWKGPEEIERHWGIWNSNACLKRTFKCTPNTSLIITSPISDELCVKGQIYPIEWSTSDSSANVKILLFKCCSKVSTLKSSTPNDGRWRWTVPSDLELGADYQIKVVCLENPVVFGFSDPFEICRPGDLYTPIEVCVPDSNCIWEMGSNDLIQWIGGDPGTTVKIKLFKGKTAVETIAADAPCDPNGGGEYNWEVPYSLTAGTNYRLKIISTDYSYVRDASQPFEIAVPDLYVTQPNGGEIWESATKRKIKWARGPEGDHVKIQLLDSTGTVVKKVLTKSTSDDGVWGWEIPTTLEPGQYVIRVISLERESRRDVSDAVFEVVYSYDRNYYALEEFRRYDVRGEHWDYETYSSGYGTSYSSVQILDKFRWIGGYKCNILKVESTGTSAVMAWFTDQNGRHLEQWTIDLPGTFGGKFKIDMNSVLVAPLYLQVGTLYTNSGPIYAQISGNVNGYDFTATINGRSEVSTKLVRWEDADGIPYGPNANNTYKAMKVKAKISIPDATMTVTVHGIGSVSGKFTVKQTETAWGVPFLGIVKDQVTTVGKISFPELDLYDTRTITGESVLIDHYNTSN